MKKNLLLLSMLVFAVSPVLAGVDVKTYTSPYYLKNAYYSDEAIRLIQLNKAYANGVQLPAMYQPENKTKRVIDAIFTYVDPGWDDHKFFRRDMPQQPGFDDL